MDSYTNIILVFLRILEYYSGILFLTTNRVGVIDDAFQSRLHLNLYYPKLTKKQTKAIFKQNFERIAEINADRGENKLPPFEYKDSELKIMLWAMGTWKTLKWNGRQIRNTFQTVLALAEFDFKKRTNESTHPVVTSKHFKIVANASIQFNDYLLAAHGEDEDKMARREYIRAQVYKPSPSLQKLSDSSDEEEVSSDELETDSDSDDSTESYGGKKKKKSKAKKGKESKSSSSKKSRKTSDRKEKSERKLKEKKKGNKENEESDETV